MHGGIQELNGGFTAYTKSGDGGAMAGTVEVLLIDDDPDLLELGRIFLEQAGYGVTPILSASAALQILKRRRFDAIVSDYHMADMDGIDLLKRLRTQDDKTPFIIFTGRSRESVAVEALNCGADFFIQKGGSPTSRFGELARKISYAVARRQAEEDLAAKNAELEQAYADLAEKQEALAVSEERLRQVAETIPISYYVYDLTHHRYLYISPAYEQIWGRSRDEIYQNPDAFHIAIHADDLERVLEAILAEHEHGIPLDIEYRIIRPDSSMRWIHTRTFPIADPSGDSRKVAGYSEDITDRKEIEDSLKMHSMIVQNMAEGVVMVSAPTGRIIYANPRFETMFGYGPGELAGRHISTVNAPDDRSAADTAAEIIRNLQEEGRWSGEVHNIRKDGTDFWCSAHVSPLVLSPYGQVWIGVHEDITRKKQTEATLRESEERYYKLVQSIPDYVIVHRMGTILFINQAAASSFGYPADELIGSNLFQYLTPESRQVAAGMMERRMMGEKNPPYEISVLTRNGEVKVARVSGVLIQFEGGLASLNVLTDITAEKRATDELEETNQLFSRFIEFSPIYTYIKEVTATESRVLYASENFHDMIGFPGREIAGKKMEDLFPLPFAEKMTADDWQVITDGQVLRLQEHFLGKDYISVKFPIIQKHRTLLGGYTIDITELKQIEAALHEANQKVRLLSSLTRHDVYNQLSVLYGLFGFMEEDGNPRTARYAAKAMEACAHIRSIVEFTREYEDFGTVQSGWYRIRPIIESAKSEVDLDGIRVENQVSDDLEVYADPVIRKVFATFLENAVRHGERITRITFSSSHTGEDLIITCADDGIGIPPEEKSHIFNHGYGKNTGIGLFLAREILSITRLSIRECGVYGEGARFEILVPAGAFRVSE